MSKPEDGYYIVLISVHGLIRGHDLELGRDADTGGQTLYVLDLMRALSQHPDVARVDLLTRRVQDAKVSEDYARPHEQVGPKAHIIRLPCGPRRYLRKEVLWPHLDSFADQALKHIRKVGQVPDVIHGHYADAGYVGVRLSNLLETPLIFTGHSLGHVKRERLIERGIKTEVIEKQYHISERIEAENMALDNASLVVASTHQEVEVQYSRYDNYQPGRMVVIPPGIDLQRFYPPKPGHFEPGIYGQIKRFLVKPERPMILAIARPDPRKNLTTLVEAYARKPELREMANLVIVAGNREDLGSMEKGPRRVLSELMMLIDRHDLYGYIAYPKHHQSEDVPYLYRIAARTRGVFVNPALTEPFGLTLLEAAASGLPIIATNDGGPQDIIEYCKNGLLIDPLDTDGLADALYEALSDKRQWQRWSKSGISGVERHFSWDGHVLSYLEQIGKLMGKITRRHGPPPTLKSKLPVSDRVLVCDIDNTLIGDEDALDDLLRMTRETPERIGFGVATGRRLDSAIKVLKEWSVPSPDFIISAAGSEIHYGPKLVEDETWKRHIDYRWEPELVREAMRGIPGLRLQPKDEQRRFKISYFVDTDRFPGLREMLRHLRQLDIHASAIYSHEAYFDVLPVRASKGAALRYLADKWGIPLEHILAAGDSGNDEEMLTGQTLGVVVGNHSAEIEKLRGNDRVYFADGHYAAGIIEGIRHYDFLGSNQARKKEATSAGIAT